VTIKSLPIIARVIRQSSGSFFPPNKTSTLCRLLSSVVVSFRHSSSSSRRGGWRGLHRLGSEQFTMAPRPSARDPQKENRDALSIPAAAEAAAADLLWPSCGVMMAVASSQRTMLQLHAADDDGVPHGSSGERSRIQAVCTERYDGDEKPAGVVRASTLNQSTARGFGTLGLDQRCAKHFRPMPFGRRYSRSAGESRARDIITMSIPFFGIAMTMRYYCLGPS
jgi:hypothetical protein